MAADAPRCDPRHAKSREPAAFTPRLLDHYGHDTSPARFPIPVPIPIPLRPAPVPSSSPPETPDHVHRSLDHHGRGPARAHPGTVPSRWAPLRPLVLRLHFYAGVLVAPFLLVAAATGFLYAGAFQAERLVYAHELTVPVGDRELPISQQVAAARTAHPEGTVSAVRPSPRTVPPRA